MAIVNVMGRIFCVVLEHGEEKLEFDFKQLDYQTKSKITGIVTYIDQGQVQIDAALQVFYNIKHGLKNVVGLTNADGTDYELKFENKQKTLLTDACVDELLATEFSDNLQYAGRQLNEAVLPTAVLHPITGEPLAGVSVIPPKELVGIRKKS